MSEPFIAEIRIWACNFAPRGWAFCDGQLLPIAQNTALFSLLGTTYGGDGRTTVGLPNLEDRVPMHPGRGPGLTARRLGQKGGSETITLTEAQLPNHNHLWNVSTKDPDANIPTEKGPASLAQLGRGGRKVQLAAFTTETTTLKMNSHCLGSAGGQPHDNRQPFLTINFCIALVGLYPSRS